jgi:hypothetical protein
MTNNFVKICIRFPAYSDGAASESPWAEPVQANGGGGTYRLQNDLLFTPLRHGDLVRCELDADSILQVVEILEVVPGLLLGFDHPENTEEIVKPVLERHVARGFEVNRIRDGLAEIFVPQGKLDRGEVSLEIPANWVLAERLDGPQRLDVAERDIDFDLNTVPYMNHEPIDYWAADDPAWTEVGVDHPDVLGIIQSLAASDPRVLATIQAGRHRDVLTYMERLSTPDPRDLPKLDRPLLVNPADA